MVGTRLGPLVTHQETSYSPNRTYLNSGEHVSIIRGIIRDLDVRTMVYVDGLGPDSRFSDDRSRAGGKERRRFDGELDTSGEES